MPQRILIADDHVIVRDGIKGILLREGFEVVGEASDGREAVRLAAKLRPQIAILDLAMPFLNGLDTGRQINSVSPETKNVLLTMYKEDQYVVEALKAGVHGYILKTQAGVDLIQAIREIGRGAIYLSPGISRNVIRQALTEPARRASRLSAREREVLQLIAEGKTTKEIARLLDLSIKTAETHRTNLMTKLDIHETAGLVRYAIRHGIVQA